MKARGFTLIELLTTVAIVAPLASIAAPYGQLYSHAAQREREAELLFIGGQFRDAIASYYNRGPGAKAYPKKIDDLSTTTASRRRSTICGAGIAIR